MVKIRIADQVRQDLTDVLSYCHENAESLDGTTIGILKSLIERFSPEIWECSTMTFIETKHRAIKVRDFVSVVSKCCKAYKVLHDICVCMDTAQSQLDEFGQYTLCFPANVKLKRFKAQVFTAILS